MTDPTNLLGGYWAGVGRTPVADALAGGCALLARCAPPLTGVPAATRVMTLRADQAVAGQGPDGRAITGYPAPDPAPAYAHPGLVVGIDFDVDGGYVWFDTDPLTDATVPAYLVWAAGVAVRTADVLYQPAPVVPAPTAAVAPSLAALQEALAAACDGPLTGAAAETVEDVRAGVDGRVVVVTGAAAYVLPAGDESAAAVGDVLPPRSPVGTGWALTRLGPDKPDLPHLTLPAWFHQGATVGPTTWYDESVPLAVDTVDGRTRVRWRLGAAADDFDTFWAESHARGTTVGAKSLARAMDLRTGAGGDPGAESLPATVNPLEFLCRELLGGNAYLLLVRPDRFGPRAVTAAARQAAVRRAVRTACAVFEYENEMPAVAPVDPS